MPKVSIVLPSYNGARYLRESIDSCLNQTLADLELIIVDDCSMDETPDILKSYNDPRMLIIRHDVNKKLPGALNTGFAASCGDYLTWTSDDNLYHPNALEVMVQALDSRPDLGLVYSGCRLVDEFGALIRIDMAEPPELLRQKSVVGACFLYRRTVYEQIGDYNADLFRIEDYEYWLRIAQHCQIAALSDILYDYRVHAGSVTSEETLVQRARAYDDVQTKMFGPDPKRFKHYLGELYIARAFEDYLAGRYRQVAPNVLRALTCNQIFINNRGVWSIFFRSLLKGKV